MDPVVLVVDDNDDNRFTLSMHLETCGYSNIVTAEDGREALQKMRSGPVDLALLDIMMPELDGYGVLEEMRSDVALRDIPVVMISALEDINSVVRCIEEGAVDEGDRNSKRFENPREVGAAGSGARAGAEPLAGEFAQRFQSQTFRDRDHKRRVVHRQDRAHGAETPALGPLAGAVPSFPSDAHRDHSERRLARFEQDDVAG